MPLGDGTGPPQGSARGQGRGRMGGNRQGAGSGGNCICPGCGASVAHQVGVPCYSVKCPKCGMRMVRK
ncbi:hypothetical protein KAW48_09530 [candidate division WOR-3 bacterium]|nr:hypothetical protein [candidate division WOR-3 bacterium]